MLDTDPKEPEDLTPISEDERMEGQYPDLQLADPPLPRWKTTTLRSV
jgi:hypothetical protein